MSSSQVKYMDSSGMEPYSEYKDSGIEWIGEIPQHWDVTKLKFVSNIKTGEKDTINKEDEGKYPFYVRSQTPERINTYSFDGEAILTAGDGDIGKIFHYYNGKFDYHQRVYKISDFKTTDGKYVFYFMTNKFYEHVVGLSAKSTVDSLRLPMLLDFPLSFGTLPEQQAIATFLDRETSRIDTLVEKKQQFIELLEERRSALISHSVTKGLDPDVPMKKSGIEWIGEIPHHWDVTKLKRITTLVYGNSLPKERHTKGNIPIYGSNGITGYHNESITSNPCIIIGRKGSFGKVNYSDIECFPIDTTFFIDNTATEQKIRWLYYLLSILKLDLLSKSSAIPGLSREDAYFKSVPIPPLQEQQAIANYLDRETSQIDTLIEKTEQSIEYLKEYRTAIISSAVTGKIDVRGTVSD